ncbi:flagellar export protein FliJ [Halomonas sp. C05BenzN]|uniref:flagellar export protein FliJ n=1 Tax=Halomonas sp. C05BenzN TaxID=3411041 RepID=UPI003B9639DB
MMRAASTPLETLVDLARDARDQAGQALAGERRSEQQVAGQLESLGRYRLEYAQRLQQAMREGIDPATMRNYQRFLDSLDDALDRARQALAAQQQRVGQRQVQWQQEQRKLSSYDTLVSRRAMEQNLQEQRRELRASDDLVNARLIRERHASHDT